MASAYGSAPAERIAARISGRPRGNRGGRIAEMTHMFPGLGVDDLSDNEDWGVERLRVTAHRGAHQSTLPGVTPRSWTAESRARPHPLGLGAQTPAAPRFVATQIANLKPSTRLLHCNISFPCGEATRHPSCPADEEERIPSWSARIGFSTQRFPDLGKCAMCADAAARFKMGDFCPPRRTYKVRDRL